MNHPVECRPIIPPPLFTSPPPKDLLSSWHGGGLRHATAVSNFNYALYEVLCSIADLREYGPIFILWKAVDRGEKSAGDAVEAVGHKGELNGAARANWPLLARKEEGRGAI